MDGRTVQFINGIGIIAPQKTYESDAFLSEITSYDHNVLLCQTPDFKTHISPVQLRRLSRMLRIGLTSSILCLRDAGVTIPDGIITATGYGFLEETEKFLREILERNERQLTPTYFMQGTYNALAGLVALSIKCTGYNNTYVSRGFAFETALQDAIMQLTSKPDSNLLIGAYDEAAAVQYAAGLREGHYKVDAVNNLALFESKSPGTLQGEGSAFFLLSGVPVSNTWCTLADMQMTYRPNEEELTSALRLFLRTNNIRIDDVDVWISGASGDLQRDALLDSLKLSILGNTPEIRFKHLSGEYCTAVSFAVWLGAAMLKKQIIPEAVRSPGCHYTETLNRILIVNHYLGRNYSFILLER